MHAMDETPEELEQIRREADSLTFTSIVGGFAR